MPHADLSELARLIGPGQGQMGGADMISFMAGEQMGGPEASAQGDDGMAEIMQFIGPLIAMQQQAELEGRKLTSEEENRRTQIEQHGEMAQFERDRAKALEQQGIATTKHRQGLETRQEDRLTRELELPTRIDLAQKEHELGAGARETEDLMSRHSQFLKSFEYMSEEMRNELMPQFLELTRQVGTRPTTSQPSTQPTTTTSATGPSFVKPGEPWLGPPEMWSDIRNSTRLGRSVEGLLAWIKARSSLASPGSQPASAPTTQPATTTTTAPTTQPELPGILHKDAVWSGAERRWMVPP